MSIIYEPKGRAREYSYLAINIFNGCRHDCSYCYAKKMAVQYGKDFSNVTVRNNLLSQLGKDVAKYAGTNKRVLLCFTCDPYQPPQFCPPAPASSDTSRSSGQNKTRGQGEELITRRVIELLRLNDIPFQVLTKGGTRACRDFDLYGPNDAFATTMTFIDNKGSIAYEPNAALPADRIKAIQKAHEMGIETWISLEPVIEPQQSLQIIDFTREYCDLYKIGKLNHIKNNTDWQAFALAALNRCKKYRKPYYIKDDLKPYLAGIQFENTDTRMVKR